MAFGWTAKLGMAGQEEAAAFRPCVRIRGIDGLARVARALDEGDFGAVADGTGEVRARRSEGVRWFAFGLAAGM